MGLLILLALTVAVAFVLVATRRVSIADMRTLLEVLFTPLVALTGTALGFYFGGREQP